MIKCWANVEQLPLVIYKQLPLILYCFNDNSDKEIANSTHVFREDL